MRRRTATAPVVAAVAALALVLAGCSQQSGLALARQACGNVATSLRLYGQAERATTEAQALAYRQKAYDQLRIALPLAAAANSDDGHWNALMTDISETARVDEGRLLVSLHDVCKEADGSQSNQAQANVPSGSGGTVGSLPSSGSGGTVGSLPSSGSTRGTTPSASPSTLPGQAG